MIRNESGLVIHVKRVQILLFALSMKYHNNKIMMIIKTIRIILVQKDLGEEEDDDDGLAGNLCVSRA
jgi:hypothetical protein